MIGQKLYLLHTWLTCFLFGRKYSNMKFVHCYLFEYCLWQHYIQKHPGFYWEGPQEGWNTSYWGNLCHGSKFLSSTCQETGDSWKFCWTSGRWENNNLWSYRKVDISSIFATLILTRSDILQGQALFREVKQLLTWGGCYCFTFFKIELFICWEIFFFSKVNFTFLKSTILFVERENICLPI